MSADNWTTCPRCFAEAQEAVETERQGVTALYGTVSVDEFDTRRAALREVSPADFRTFREDYEFFGAEGGVVNVSYSGSCSKCGLRAELETSKRFWP